MATKKHICICINCNKEIEGQIFKKGKKTYCEDCIYEIDPEWGDWCILFEYIKKLYNVKTPSLQVITQLQKYHKDNKLSFYGMYYTLKYVYELGDLELDKEKGVGIIPYYYEKAKDFLEKKYSVEDNIDEYDFEPIVKIINTQVNYNCVKTNKDISLESWKEQDEE